MIILSTAAIVFHSRFCDNSVTAEEESPVGIDGEHAASVTERALDVVLQP